MNHPKPTKQLIIDVNDLRRRLGQRMDVEIDVILPPLEVLASHLLETEPVTGAVTFDSIERGVVVDGAISFSWEGDCRRCLEPVTGVMEAPVSEVFQTEADDDEVLEFDGEHVDLLPLVRDAVLIGLPLVPLCSEDCAGPDPERYPAVPADEWERQVAEAAAEAPDPRWSALSDLELE